MHIFNATSQIFGDVALNVHVNVNLKDKLLKANAQADMNEQFSEEFLIRG